jgi:hypothetical protein
VPTSALLRDADPLSLAWQTLSPDAEAMVSDLLEAVIAWEQPNRSNLRRGVGRKKLREALAAIVGGLLVSWGRPIPCAVSRSLKKDDFSASPVGYDTYKTAKDGLAALGFVVIKEGVQFSRGFTFQGLPEVLVTTEALVSLAAHHGVFLKAARQHFRIVPSEKCEFRGHVARDSDKFSPMIPG